MIKLKQAVIVEGKYDKAKLSSLVDATIVTTDGFDVFRDREKLAYIRALAEKNGVIILTDSDAAGFRIRAHIAGAVDPEKITHVYIPDIFGKERRKTQPSAEGKLGVEGMPAGVLLDALRRAGVAVEGQDAPPRQSAPRPSPRRISSSGGCPAGRTAPAGAAVCSPRSACPRA